jgi:hypothetical protein
MATLISPGIIRAILFMHLLCISCTIFVHLSHRQSTVNAQTNREWYGYGLTIGRRGNSTNYLPDKCKSHCLIKHFNFFMPDQNLYKIVNSINLRKKSIANLNGVIKQLAGEKHT